MLNRKFTIDRQTRICKPQNGKVTVNLLKSCVEDLVPELSKKHKGQPQFPTGYGFGMDFPVVMVT